MDFPKNREIDALVPEYTETGDATHVYLRDGSDYVIDVTLKTVLKFLAYRSCRDICRLREWSAEHTHKRLNNPLPLDEELVLMPYRARHPRVAGDAIMGCVNAAAGVRLKEDEGTLLLTALPLSVQQFCGDGQYLSGGEIGRQMKRCIRRRPLEKRVFRQSDFFLTKGDLSPNI